MQSTHQSVSARAYALWEQEGRPHGRDLAHWLEAERQVRMPAALGQDRPQTAGAPQAAAGSQRGIQGAKRQRRR